MTGEYSTIMISVLKTDKVESDDWLSMYFRDFRRRLIKLLSKTFPSFTTGLALSLLDNKAAKIKNERKYCITSTILTLLRNTLFFASTELSQTIIDTLFIPHDLQRLESYTRNQVDYRLIIDLTTDLAQLVLEGKMTDVAIDSLQKAILLGIGLQNKTLDKLSEEFNMPVNQILAKFYDCCKKLYKKLESVNESTIEKTMIQESALNMGESMNPTAQTFAEELEEGARELAKAQKKELKRLKNENLSAYKIKGTDEDWGKALATNKSGIISVKR